MSATPARSPGATGPKPPDSWPRSPTRTTKRRPTDDAVPSVVGVRKLAPSQGWAISDKQAHEALVSEADFIAAQNVSAQNEPADGGSRIYLLVGLLRCGTCGRSMHSQLNHGNVAYRCRHGHTSAHTAAMRQAPNLYLREDVILGRVYAQLRTITSREAGVAAQIARLQENRNMADVIRFLRAHHVVIECHATSVTLEPDHEKSIIMRSSANGSELEVRIPRQRTQRQRQERDIAERRMPRGSLRVRIDTNQNPTRSDAGHRDPIDLDARPCS